MTTVMEYHLQKYLDYFWLGNLRSKILIYCQLFAPLFQNFLPTLIWVEKLPNFVNQKYSATVVLMNHEYLHINNNVCPGFRDHATIFLSTIHDKKYMVYTCSMHLILGKNHCERPNIQTHCRILLHRYLWKW